jgi:hypothetical protein
MATTNQLSQLESPNAGDLLPVWSTANGSNRALSFSNLANWIATALSNMTVAGYVKVKPVTVANLPNPVAVGAGARAFVSDATSTTFHAAAVGGGANQVPVFVDGNVGH